jgi:Lrp/AsnC family transcriptional regulator for asnA, asnC and gidA
MDFMGKAREFSQLRGVVSAGVVTGRFHLMLTVLLKPDFGLLEFYRDEVSRIADVEDCETFVVYGSEKLLVPYVL